MRFRAKGPAIDIAWAIGPGLRFPRHPEAQRGCEKMGRAPSRSRENSANISLCEVPVPIFFTTSKGRPFVSIENARPFRPPGQGADSSPSDGPSQAIEWRGRKRGQVRRTGAGLFCCVPRSLEHQPGGMVPFSTRGRSVASAAFDGWYAVQKRGDRGRIERSAPSARFGRAELVEE